MSFTLTLSAIIGALVVHSFVLAFTERGPLGFIARKLSLTSGLDEESR
ncbi:MAG TPA: hypothetical protein VGO62_07955 [Myxococcota bacterium]|jgi:hypothetical protein